MYTREKLCRDQNHKSRKGDRNPPSFSSTLLDEIYRSIDGNVEKTDDLNGYKEKNLWRRGGYEELATSLRVEKWMMEKEANERAASKKRQQLLQELDNDFIFFSSTSSSSDSSGALSSSDTEFFGSTGGRSKPKVSCFATRPKPVRTGTRSDRSEPRKDCRFKPDDERQNRVVVEDELIKSKSRALKIYANLKKVKQPISPGGRLTTFINSLFSNANGKKSSRNPEASRDGGPSTACSSASSFSRSCLSKYSPRSREKMRNGDQRTVRFESVSGDSRPCGHKSVYDGDSGQFGRPPLPPSTLPELRLNKKVEPVTHDNRVLKGYNSKMSEVFYNVDEDEDDDDCLSDSSSDLFELDHLELYGSNRYNEELPVYETTHFDTNRAIASGLIR